MIERTVTVKNRSGIHARPAMILVTTILNFKSSVQIEKENHRVDAKSIMGVITLGAGYGTSLKLIADGEDEQEAITALENLFNAKFEEE